MSSVALKRIVWTLVVLLSVSAAFISLDERGGAADPTPTSVAPGGARLLADLLRAEGYEVSELRAKPKRPDPSVAWLWFSAGGRTATQGANKWRDAHLTAGGTVVVMPFESDFRTLLTEVVRGKQRVRLGGRVLTVHLGRPAQSYLEEGDETESVATDEGRLFVIERSGKGRVLRLTDGGAFLNRPILEGDNAALATYIASTTGKRRFAFVPSSFGGGRPVGLLETLGPGFTAGFYQAAILLFAMAVTLGRRFGLPSGIRHSVRGARDLPDAVEGFFLGRRGAARLAELEMRRIERLRGAVGDSVRLAELADETKPDPKAVFAAATRRPEGPADPEG